jgi:hypothetical protein
MVRSTTIKANSLSPQIHKLLEANAPNLPIEKNNPLLPFAPGVPCHRVLAADGSLGGYKGEWKVDAHKGGGSTNSLKQTPLTFPSKKTTPSSSSLNLFSSQNPPLVVDLVD